MRAVVRGREALFVHHAPGDLKLLACCADVLMTIRSEGQFNTVVYDEEDLYRGNATRDVVMMSADDAASLGLTEGDPVRVTSATGSMDVVAPELKRLVSLDRQLRSYIWWT